MNVCHNVFRERSLINTNLFTYILPVSLVVRYLLLITFMKADYKYNCSFVFQTNTALVQIFSVLLRKH